MKRPKSTREASHNQEVEVADCGTSAMETDRRNGLVQQTPVVIHDAWGLSSPVDILVKILNGDFLVIRVIGIQIPN